MLGNIKFLVSMVFGVLLFVFTLAPALETVVNTIRAATGTPEVSSFARVETVLFVGLPLVMVFGVILIVFVVAAGLRGTSR
jgi:uncharacterized membrane protein YcgQ (UPF0703/DUF1980 family)